MDAMELFYAERLNDLTEYFANYGKIIEKGILTPEQIFIHAYTLGALQNANSKESENN